jgi:hypothetical protein
LRYAIKNKLIEKTNEEKFVLTQRGKEYLAEILNEREEILKNGFFGREEKQKELRFKNKIVEFLRIIKQDYFDLLKENFKEDYPFVCRYACYVLAKLLSRHLNIPIGGEALTRIELTSGVVVNKENMKIREFHRWITLYINGKKTLIIDPTYGQFDKKLMDGFLLIDYNQKDKIGYIEFDEKTENGLNKIQFILEQMAKQLREISEIYHEQYRDYIYVLNLRRKAEEVVPIVKKITNGEDISIDISESDRKKLDEIIEQISKSLEEKKPLTLATKNLSNINPVSTANINAQKILPDYGWIKENAKEFFGKTIVFVSPGFKLTEDFLKVFEDKNMKVKIANAHQTGGLEPLVTEEITKIAELGINAVGVSLLYEYAPVQTKDGSIVLEKLNYQDAIDKGKLVYVGKILVPIYGKEEVVKVYAAKFETKTGKNACVLYLSHPEITTEIYPANYEIREKQMILLGRGTLAILKEIKENPEFKKAVLSVGLPFDEIEPIVVQLNEALTSFAHPKVITDKFTNDSYLNSLIYGFTTHTPVEAGLQKIPIQNAQKIGLDSELWQYGIIKGGQIDLTKICLSLCNVVNGVSKEHKELTESMLYPEFKGLLYGIVNGINLDHWQLKDFR